MQNYYVVYDATPYDDFGEDFIQVGLGKINPELPTRQYDPSIFITHDEDGIHAWKYKNETHINDDETEPEQDNEDKEDDEIEEIDINNDKIPDPEDNANVIPDSKIDGEDDFPVLGVVIGVIAAVIVLGICCFFYKKRKNRNYHYFHGRYDGSMNINS